MRKKIRTQDTKKPESNIEQYTHKDKKRPYNPPVGLVTPDTDKDLPKKKYSYDPHLDPQLIWSGKKENTSFEVDTVSLHVHERIDPITIIENVMKKQKFQQQTLFHYFELPENNLPNRQAIEFYKHDQNWSNRLIAGDSLLVMNSLLQKEGMEGKVQMIYIDPPYGIKYGSNFQPFVNKRDVVDGKDEDLSQEPETIKAFRDTWELGLHSYLSYVRDRLLLAKELLSDTGSCFVQISDDNIHHMRELMDEIFGKENFIVTIIFTKTGAHSGEFLEPINNYIIWYSKNKKNVKYHPLFIPREWSKDNTDGFNQISIDGTVFDARKLDDVDITKLFRGDPIISKGHRETTSCKIELDGKIFDSGYNYHWAVAADGIKNLYNKDRVVIKNDKLYFKRYFSDFPVKHSNNIWTNIGGAPNIKYVVETNPEVIKRCILMTTDPDDLVLDPTAGAGTTAYVCEQWGRRWITCDTSRVAITLTKQRLMTSIFDFYTFSHPNEGIKSGFKYTQIPHILPSSIANDNTPSTETLYDKPIIDKTKIRISGPFTVEAVPSPLVKSHNSDEQPKDIPDMSYARLGETFRQNQWRDELLKTGIRGKDGQKIEFSRVEILSATQWINADAETNESNPKRVAISFGPNYAPIEQRQVANVIDEAQDLIPKPSIVVFAAFQFDPEAAKDIDEMNWPGVTLLKVQMNGDLFTDDLKKNRSGNESFWLVGQPDVELQKQKDGKYIVEVKGFDYYNTKSGEIESGDSSKIATWELDTDYDGRSLYPNQIFFPMSGLNDGWTKLAKTLKTEIDEDKIEQYRGTVSLPFDLGINKKVAVKIIDDRGIESLRIIRVK